MFFDRGEFGGPGVVTEDDVGCFGRGLEGDASAMVHGSWLMVIGVERVDVPAIALCEIDGFVA